MGQRLAHFPAGTDCLEFAIDTRRPSYQRERLQVNFRCAYLVVTNDCVHIDELRVRHIGRLEVMLCVHMRRVTVVVCIPSEV